MLWFLLHHLRWRLFLRRRCEPHVLVRCGVGAGDGRIIIDGGAVAVVFVWVLLFFVCTAIDTVVVDGVTRLLSLVLSLVLGTQRRRRSSSSSSNFVAGFLGRSDGRIDLLRLVLLVLVLLLDEDGTTLGMVANDGRFEIWAVI